MVERLPSISALDAGRVGAPGQPTRTSVNPTSVVPMGPDVDYTAPHERARLNKQPAKAGA